ncbi:hypothetical protein HYH03_010202 [Edaphochlamys debaryana]|uniref:Uncharacterized protein n=1 Tax=Edaphochlamys debaryana TaxID=47281 RepID=A0A836BXN6_9CHLO|nr:hypothetical protein HYH03_010202 [Edaphochlamys debaryana]|eukprot:KAG2491413.1 hypothetical protein HYH03_010202 [Edaphochlamys debaryana]
MSLASFSGRCLPAPAPCRRLKAPLSARKVAGPASARGQQLGESSLRRSWVVQAAEAAGAEAPSTSEAAAEVPTEDEVAAEEKKSEEYSEVMQKKMGTTLTYRHEDGLNYNRIMPDIIVGSCLQTPADVDYLAEKERVRVVFCLQEDPDMEYFSLDIKPIQERCAERGDIKHVRFPIRDFDPFDLRRKLPKAVSRLAREHDPNAGTVYIHCTAGLGRAPATALAYMFWLRDMQLDFAYELLRSQRLCSPRIDAIRSATVDLLVGTDPVPVTIGVHRLGTTSDWKIAGLDVGWHQQLPLTTERGPHGRATGRLVLKRTLQPGRYPYKFIVDGNWTYSADHPTYADGNNTNNYIEVLGRSVPDHLAIAQQRILAQGGDLTQDERDELRAMLCPWATHDELHGTVREGAPPAWASMADKLP